MRNPLNNRIPKNIKKDWKKYLVLCLLLILTISLVCAMYVANNSMERTFAEAFEDYNIEDGHFELEDEATEFLLEQIENEGITVYPQFYKDFTEDKDSDGTKEADIRIFEIREEVNLVALIEGEMPKATDEIAIDNRHAGNVNMNVGDVITVGDKKMKVTGLVSLSDYSTLFIKNTDTMFDAITFDIGVVTKECFEGLEGTTVWQYAYQYNDRPTTDEEKKILADDLIPKVAVLAATGGYLDDEDEAKELSDNVEIWSDYLEDVQDKADDLEKRSEDLKARADEFEREGKALEAESVELKEMALLKRGASELETFGNELKNKEEELQKRADELKARGEALQEERDALQAEGDALKALQPTIDEYVDNLEALEKYEDHINKLTDFVPEYLCQAIHFAPDDMGSDKAMCEVLLIVLVVVLAFIFAITASNTITAESKVIGTLRASGYTRRELLMHYVSVPVILTLASAIIGNVIGYTLLRGAVVFVYGRSYSLPPIKTYWDGEAFIRTTIFPVVTVIVINTVIVYFRLKHSPLKFLRGDLSVRKNKKAVKLPKFSFFARFRIRIFNQNVPGYLVLFAGIFFVMVLLIFSVGMPVTLKGYIEKADEFAVSEYQYILKSTEDEDGNKIDTKTEGAEKFSMENLSTVDGVRVGEQVTIYGYSKDSKYYALPYDIEKGNVYISKDYAEKFKLSEGDTVSLKAKYAKDAYRFNVVGIFDMTGSIALFMPNDKFNEIFDLEEGSFTGFVSDKEITDIDDEYIGAVITSDDLMKMANQLSYSMGGIMDIFSYFCGAMAILIIYLLTKIIIENNATSISMVKVLGYKNREIGRLYVMLTGIVVILSTLVTAAISYLFVRWLWAFVMYGMAGWFKFSMTPLSIVKCIVIVLIAYTVVSLVDMRRIRRVPLTEALKNVE
ncbi:MAG: FtsX-like permease family protein [Lachnospiraceae bacterium]|nr:FtsX-like permease family protein [Lachnospiraceae bacterium]